MVKTFQAPVLIHCIGAEELALISAARFINFEGGTLNVFFPSSSLKAIYTNWLAHETIAYEEIADPEKPIHGVAIVASEFSIKRKLITHSFSDQDKLDSSLLDLAANSLYYRYVLLTHPEQLLSLLQHASNEVVNQAVSHIDLIASLIRFSENFRFLRAKSNSIGGKIFDIFDGVRASFGYGALGLISLGSLPAITLSLIKDMARTRQIEDFNGVIKLFPADKFAEFLDKLSDSTLESYLASRLIIYDDPIDEGIGSEHTEVFAEKLNIALTAITFTSKSRLQLLFAQKSDVIEKLSSIAATGQPPKQAPA